ncbi:hypothetical protein sos41_02000 [Alphaproteobacteria bacterium SO-S41]|nr:hypothetical protein sos41_02000 [Alphaproteobacteria bacterium SO-S41]
MADVADHKALITRVFAAFERGDMAPLAEALHDDVVWRHNGQMWAFDFADQDWIGKAAVLKALAMLTDEYPMVGFTAEEMCGEGDALWVLVDARRRSPKGEVMHSQTAHRYRFKDGKIIAFLEILDSGEILFKAGKLDVAAGRASASLRP